MGRIFLGSDCHSQCLDPLLRSRTDLLGVVRQFDPCGRIISICKRLLGELLQCRMVWCHSVQTGVGLIIKAPYITCHYWLVVTERPFATEILTKRNKKSTQNISPPDHCKSIQSKVE
jgi:hypothetical protein